MTLVTDIIVTILTIYLTLANGLADVIHNWLPSTNVEHSFEISTTENEPLQRLPSQNGAGIPDILLQSAAYQKAAVSDATGITDAHTTDPLAAIVNIYCTYTTEELIRTTTGTGFFIDSDGVIMTNAHVAQFLLLEETAAGGETKCTVRSGSPAVARYQAELLYLPPAWIQENAGIMHESVPMGTGERDYALLYVSESVDTKPLPASFPSLAVDTTLLPVTAKDSAVLAAGYPAEALFNDGPSAPLIPRQATTSISELYTFGSNYADVFSVRGSEVGAEGTSGGPVLNDDGAVIGMIVTRGDDTIDGNGSLRAITLSYVDRTITEETGFSLLENLGGNLPYRAHIFGETVTPFLVTLLEQAR